MTETTLKKMAEIKARNEHTIMLSALKRIAGGRTKARGPEQKVAIDTLKVLGVEPWSTLS